MLGQEYFERRIGDIFDLSPIPYISGSGDLRNLNYSVSVDWELNVSITGESILVLTSNARINNEDIVDSNRRFVKWELTGSTANNSYTIKGEGVILHRSSYSSNDMQCVYHCRFQQIDITTARPMELTRLDSLLRNFTFWGLEFSACGTDNVRDKFHVLAANRRINFHLSPHEKKVKELIDNERIDQALMSEVHIPLNTDEALDDGLQILFTLQWIISLLNLNQVSAPVVKLMSGDNIYGWRILQPLTTPYMSGEIIDNFHINGGIKIFIETLYDRIVSLDGSLGLRRFIDMVLTMNQQRTVEFKLAGLLLAYEFLCTSFLTYSRATPSIDSNIQQKLNCVNTHLRFIPRTFLDDTLRADIRNPLFHQGQIVEANIQQLYKWYTSYFDLLLHIIFAILGYNGTFLSRVDYTLVTVKDMNGTIP